MREDAPDAQYATDLLERFPRSGPALAAGWAAGAIPFVLMGRQEVGGIDLRRVALVWQLVLASAHVFGYDAEPITFVEGTDHLVGGVLAHRQRV